MKKIFISTLLAVTMASSSVPLNNNVYARPARVITDKSTAMSISCKSLEIEEGETYELSINNCNKKIKWSSSDKEVVKVSKKGIVTAKKEGNVKITAKVGNKKFTCKVNVTKSEEDCENIDFEDINYDIIEVKKPVIYLYPEKEEDINVKLDYKGELVCTYPEYNDGWKVKAYPDGTLLNYEDNKEYSYLFWEGISNIEWDFSKGFVVKGEDAKEFLQETLSKIGLTAREYNEFIVYWLPQLQQNKYNLISFQTQNYEDTAKLLIEPNPDSILRVFMAYKEIDKPIEIEEQEFETFKRKGFTVVEWGGTQVK